MAVRLLEIKTTIKWDNTTSDTKFDPGTAGLDVLLSETG
jgi:hypothetical protein